MSLLGQQQNVGNNKIHSKTMHVVVIVLGDLGRSPRMQYHCISLLEAGHYVTAIGYTGEGLVPTLQEQQQHQQNDDDNNTLPAQSCSSRFKFVRFNPPTLLKNSPFYFIARLLSLMYHLSYALLFSVTKRPIDFVLVQNPPAIPLLIVAYLFCHITAFRQKGRRPGFIIDWHNLGYSMFRHGSKLQRLTKLYEQCMAPLADGHFTVTKAMKEYLMTNMGVTTSNIDILYDCPPQMFEPLHVKEQHAILSKLNSELVKCCPKSWISDYSNGDTDTNKTLFTEEYVDVTGTTCIRHRPGRPALVTSSTSWTPDEDFGLLLKALIIFDNQIKMNTTHPKLRVLVVVTGKGPERSMYEEQISQLQLEYVAVVTVWLEAIDYPKLLACADLGVSLHTSTSGLDLPMKVLDLFGCEVPVVAHDFNCLHELVKDRVNGRVFSTSDELANLLFTLLLPLQSQQGSISVPNHTFGELHTYSEQLRGRTRWHTNWLDHALPVIMLATPKQ
jgi:beta-1,4-mannosyltransferase